MMKTKQKTLDYTFFYKEDVDKFTEALDAVGKYDYVITSCDAKMLHPYLENEHHVTINVPEDADALDIELIHDMALNILLKIK